MSFDANIGRPQPVIRPTAGMNNDGGSGGNTGYMMRGRKKKDDKDLAPEREALGFTLKCHYESKKVQIESNIKSIESEINKGL